MKGAVGPSSPERVEAPVTLKAYMLCVFASFGGIFFGYVHSFKIKVKLGTRLIELVSIPVT